MEFKATIHIEVKTHPYGHEFSVKVSQRDREDRTYGLAGDLSGHIIDNLLVTVSEIIRKDALAWIAGDRYVQPIAKALDTKYFNSDGSIRRILYEGPDPI